MSPKHHIFSEQLCVVASPEHTWVIMMLFNQQHLSAELTILTNRKWPHCQLLSNRNCVANIKTETKIFIFCFSSFLVFINAIVHFKGKVQKTAHSQRQHTSSKPKFVIFTAVIAYIVFIHGPQSRLLTSYFQIRREAALVFTRSPVPGPVTGVNYIY